jgi:hypothetical protein
MSERLTGEAREVAKERLQEIAKELDGIDQHRRLLVKTYQDLLDEQARLNALVYAA